MEEKRLIVGTNLITDIKGDLLRKHGDYLRAHGVIVKSLNLINPEESDRYNPSAYLEKDTDVIRWSVMYTEIQYAGEKNNRWRTEF